MKRANVSQLKARLSAYLADVRRGDTVIVCDRRTPVARLVPYEEDVDGFTVEPAADPPSNLSKVRGVRLRRPVDVLGILRESRQDR